MDHPAPNAPLPPNETRGPAIQVASWLCLAVALFFVFCRLYTRFRITRNAALDDALVAISAVLLTISAALTSVCISHGLGRHIFYINPDDLPYMLHFSVTVQVMWIFTYSIPKIAVVMIIKKLMGPKKNGLWFLYFISAVMVVSAFLCVIFIFAQCDPPSHFWHPTDEAVCWSPNVLLYTSMFGSAWSAFVDFCLAVFPITVFWDLKINWKRKIGISVLMGFGIFAVAAAIVKIVYLPQNATADFTWNAWAMWICTNIETAIVIACACIPTLPRLVLNLLRKDSRVPQYQSPQLAKPAGSYRRIGSLRPSYNKILDTTIKDSQPDAIELSTAATGSGITRTVDTEVRWEQV